MAVALLRRTASFATSFSFSMKSSDRARDESVCRVGEYVADYSELTPEEKSATDPFLDDLLARSTVVSTKRL